LTATNSFTVVVREVNAAPVLPGQIDRTINELTLLTVTNAASEPNIHSTTIGYGLINPPAGASISAGGVITWTPSQLQSPSTNVITTVVTNSNPYDLVNPQLTATNSFTVIVGVVNMAPVLPVQSDRTINELTAMTVTNTASEPNIHSVTIGYGLINPPAGASIDANGIYTTQTLMLGLAGGVLGGIFGVAVAAAFPGMIARYFTIDMASSWDAWPALEGIAIAALVTLGNPVLDATRV
jgi:hypothetical protein